MVVNMSKKMEIDKVVFKIKRWNPEIGRFEINIYEIPVYRGMTVLDGLTYIKENIDHTLAFRRSCRMGVCGTCGVIINGKPKLACSTQIIELNSRTIVVEPLKNLPLVRDLIIDHSPFFEKQRKIKPYIIRNDVEEYWNPTREYIQKPEELEEYLQFSYCLTCALCHSACPTSGINLNYLGPQALMNAYRFIADNRDEGILERLEIVDTPDGCWGCHLAGSCSDVCPKGVDPALAIQLLRKKIIERNFGYLEVRKAARLAQALPSTEKKIDKTPPPFTVKRRSKKVK
jgi:succinate dehydrogenase / fumarate reductase iron-sulfur subunit